MSSIFGFGSRWPLGLFMAAAIVGAAGFMTIVGRERTSLAVDVLAITAWSLLGLVVAPVLGLAPPTGAAIAGYGVLLVGILAYVLRFGRWQTGFLRTVSWPVTWSLWRCSLPLAVPTDPVSVIRPGNRREARASFAQTEACWLAQSRGRSCFPLSPPRSRKGRRAGAAAAR